jgi:hypothetical protein
MRIGQWVWFLGVAGVSAGAIGLAACSSTSGGPTGHSPLDATAQEASSPEEASTAAEGSAASTDAAHDAPPDVALESGTEAGTSSDGSSDASDGGAADAPSESAACTPVDAGTPDAAAVAAGSSLANMTQSFFPAATHACGACHNANFAGGVTLMGATSKNLTPDPETGLGCWTDQQIVTAILYGMTPEVGETLCVMPKWSALGMTADQAEEIVQYLRSLPPVSNAVPETICPNDAGASDASDAGPADGSNGG